MDIARPAEFLLDSNCIVRWVNLTENIAVRARPEQVLEALRKYIDPKRLVVVIAGDFGKSE